MPSAPPATCCFVACDAHPADECRSSRTALRLRCRWRLRPTDQLLASPFTGTGVIQSTATVHRYQGTDITAPFTIAAIVLDEGPLVNGVLADRTSAKIGAAVTATTTTTTRDGSDVAELRFTVTGESS